ncbi:hypothetical protein GLOTRDRAFT_92842 [Gloeophyllum trabeum ATCC 11539]|uniref:Uncharacterized protein n=1 Tax=Gloeophyllum trabeum (strain ATCC 11539 / FP-39264 / Madison 617) TaxID=670483 RepID=S7QA19_GLOTA|nr:uncharacterized protein GLOTRDRAFT_92842 [Gloeophyllum trabeum ATCC 11539]EPQ56362.1 hypothetical protein GLOTRDRAFT_92842 [Gloeophyllum trabeum ATCC 11539]
MSNSPQPVYVEVRDAIKAQPGHPHAHVSGRFDTAVILRDERRIKVLFKIPHLLQIGAQSILTPKGWHTEMLAYVEWYSPLEPAAHQSHMMYEVSWLLLRADDYMVVEDFVSMYLMYTSSVFLVVSSTYSPYGQVHLKGQCLQTQTAARDDVHDVRSIGVDILEEGNLIAFWEGSLLQGNLYRGWVSKVRLVGQNWREMRDIYMVDIELDLKTQQVMKAKVLTAT